MSKHFKKSVVRKPTTFSPKEIERAGSPIPKNVNGTVVLMCPFCVPTHPLIPGELSKCGTSIQVRAVQKVYQAKYEPRMVCAKCGKGGGYMIAIADAFFHTNDCTPGVVVMTEKPKFSRTAALIFKLPPALRSRVESFTGQVLPVDEVTSNGPRTGVVLGYFFKEKVKTNEQTETAKMAG